MPGALTTLVAALPIKLAHYYYSSLAGVYLLWRWARTGGDVLRMKQRQMSRKLIDNYVHKYFLLSSGVNKHYVEAGDPTAPLMVMVHGYPEFWYSWRFQIDHFKDRYRVVAIDQRGYGDSSKPPDIADYSIPLLVKDVDDLIHGLGYDKAIVLGHDWGGGVEACPPLPPVRGPPHRMQLPPPRGLFDPTLGEQGSAILQYMLFYQTPRIPEAAAAVDDFATFDQMFYGLKNKENFTVEDMEAWKCTFSKPDCLKSAIDYYSCLFRHPEKGNIREKCAVKTLIIWGDKDAYLLEEGAPLSKEEIRYQFAYTMNIEDRWVKGALQWCDDATLHLIPGASHWVQQDDPNIVNEHIDDFLR